MAARRCDSVTRVRGRIPPCPEKHVAAAPRASLPGLRWRRSLLPPPACPSGTRHQVSSSRERGLLTSFISEEGKKELFLGRIPAGLERAFPTWQGRRLLNPSEASQRSGRHRRPGSALAAPPGASPRRSQRGGGKGSGSPGQGGGKAGSAPSPGAAAGRPRLRGGGGGSSRAVTQPGNVLARAAAAPGEGDARGSARPPRRGQSPRA